MAPFIGTIACFSIFVYKFQPLTLAGKSIDGVWTPDLFFTNEKAAHFHDVTVPNKLMKIYHNGSVAYSVRLGRIFAPA